MMHRAWSSIVDLPYSFSRSYVKFQGHTALKIVEFDPNWAFPDSNSSLNSPMAMKCCTKLETAKERCPHCFPRSSIKFQGHTGQNFTDFDPNWAFPDSRPVAAFKSLRFALLQEIWDRLNIEISHQGSESHLKDFYNGNLHTWKDSLYSQTGSWWCIYMVIIGLAVINCSDVIIGTVTSQISGVSIACSTVCSGVGQRKHQSSASRTFVRGVLWSPVDVPHKGPVTRKMLPFNDVTKLSRCWLLLTKLSEKQLTCRKHHRWEGSVGFRFWRPSPVKKTPLSYQKSI